MAFKPGQSGNPGGSTKRRLLTDALVSRLLWPADEKPRKDELRTTAQVIVEHLIQKALQGDMRAITEIYERVEGKAAAAAATVPASDKPMDIIEAPEGWPSP